MWELVKVYRRIPGLDAICHRHDGDWILHAPVDTVRRRTKVGERADPAILELLALI